VIDGYGAWHRLWIVHQLDDVLLFEYPEDYVDGKV
jgi:hypothetical protein